eukprot:gene277-150_t
MPAVSVGNGSKHQTERAEGGYGWTPRCLLARTALHVEMALSCVSFLGDGEGDKETKILLFSFERADRCYNEGGANRSLSNDAATQNECGLRYCMQGIAALYFCSLCAVRESTSFETSLCFSVVITRGKKNCISAAITNKQTKKRKRKKKEERNSFHLDLYSPYSTRRLPIA